MTAVPDIPRLYTALAECLATLLYAQQLTPRYSARRSTVNSLIWMAGLAVFMQLTGSVPLVLWLPCMVAAIGSMYLFLWRTCETTPLEAGYYCARAFILAELAASVEWQLHCALWPQRSGRDPLAVLLLVLVYGVLFTAVYWMEKRRSTQPAKLHITPLGMLMAVIMAITVFAVSNLSFVNNNEATMSIRYIRTLVDLAGVLILTVQHEQLRESALHSELTAMDDVLRRQYEQYRQSKENIKLINRRYHELKVQIATIRAERDQAKQGCRPGRHGKRHPPLRGREQDRQPRIGHAADRQKLVLPAARHQHDLRGRRQAAGFSFHRRDLHHRGHRAG